MRHSPSPVARRRAPAEPFVRSSSRSIPASRRPSSRPPSRDCGTPPPPGPAASCRGPAIVPSSARAENVTLNTNATVAGVTIQSGGQLTFDPNATRVLSSSANVEVAGGILQMRPASSAVKHELSFININEANFVGGGEVVLASDVGLWITGAGKLDAVGSDKTAWTHLSAGADRGPDHDHRRCHRRLESRRPDRHHPDQEADRQPGRHRRFLAGLRRAHHHRHQRQHRHAQRRPDLRPSRR